MTPKEVAAKTKLCCNFFYHILLLNLFHAKVTQLYQ
jgi:hypothetical protein